MFKLSNRHNSHPLLTQSIGFIQVISIGVLLGLASCNSRTDQASTPNATNQAQVQPSPAVSTSPSSTSSSPTTGPTSGTVNDPSDMTVDPNSANVVDNALVVKGAQDNSFEIQAGQLAAQKAANPSVKQFAQTMVRDHTKATSLLQQLAAKRNITLPAGVGEQNQALLARLKQLSGAEFDRAYMTEMVNSHQKDVALMQNQAQNGNDQQLKSLAAEKLPALENHLKMAQDLAQRLNS
jgi:putative membrane protein